MRLLFGPYGCLIAPPLNTQGEEAAVYRLEVTRIAKTYLEARATLPAVNGFFLRNLLHRGEDQLFRELLQLNYDSLMDVLSGRAVDEIALCLGPAQDCYRPELAPDTVEAFAFAQRQYRHCSFGRANIVILHETIGTVREALGISLAAQSMKLPIVVSFVVDPQGFLLDGSSVEQAIAIIDRETHQFVRGFALNCCAPCAFERAVASFSCKSLVSRLIGFYPNSWEADPRDYETSERRIEPDKRDSLRRIAEIGRKYQLQFVGCCCGFDCNDVGFLKEIV